MKTYRLIFGFIYPLILLSFLALAFPCYSQVDSVQDDYSFLDGLDVTNGPDDIKMGAIAEIKIPEGYVFLDGGDTKTLMERFGNPSSNREEGLIADKDFSWFVVFEFSNVGYVPDDEKDDLDADKMLESLIESNDEANKLREKNGWGKLTITGWELKPRYNQVSNNLEWAIRGRSDMDYPVINHSTRLLGRRGVMELTLVVDPASYPSVAPIYANLINTFRDSLFTSTLLLDTTYI